MGKVQRIRKTVSGVTYVYERTPYYDPAIKNTKYHYKYVGRETGGEVKKVRSVIPRRSLVYGPFIPVLSIVESFGIKEILNRYLAEDETQRILALAISKVVRPLPMSSIPLWYEGTYLSVTMPAGLRSQRISELMEKIGSSDLYRKFSRDLIDRIHPSESLLYDITSIPAYSSMSILKYGHAEDHPELEQINLSMVMEKDRKIPLFFEIYPGSIPDVVTLKGVISTLSPMMASMSIIPDRGFFSLENLRIIKEMRYIMAASLVRKDIKSVFAKTSRTVDRSDNVILYEGEPIFCQHVSFSMEDLNLQGYFYHDIKRESMERSDFHKTLAQRRKAIESIQATRGMKKRIEQTAGFYIRYISYRIENGTFITGARNNAVSVHENRMGRFLLVYNGEYSASEVLSMYRQRDAIEKAFRMVKTDLDIFPMRDHSENTVRGSMFLFFLSLLIRSAILRGMQSTKLIEKYSVEKMFLELEKLHMMEDYDGEFRELERTRNQKEILDTLGTVSWW